MKVPRWFANVLLAILAVVLLAAALLPQFLVTVYDEESWRRLPPVPTIVSLNDYLKDCGSCLHRPEAVQALTEAGRPAGLVAWLKSTYDTGRRTANAQILQGGFSPDGSTVVTSGSGFGSVWNLANVERAFRLTPFQANRRISQEERDRFGYGIEQTVFSGAAAIASVTSPGTVIMWDGRQGAQQQIFETKMTEPSSLVASPAGVTIAFVRGSEAAVSLDTVSGKVTQYVHPGINLVVFPKSDTLVTASQDRVMWWALDSPAARSTVTIATESWGPLSFSEDGELVLHHTRGPLEVWGTRDGKRVQVLGDRSEEGHESQVTAACSPGKSSFAVTGTEDGFVHLWSLETGRRLGRYRAHASHIDRLICHGASRRILSIGHRFAEAKVWAADSFGKEVAPVLRGQPVTGQGWAAQLAADWGLEGRFPGMVSFFTGYRNETTLFSLVGLVAVACVVSWLRTDRRKGRNRKRR